LQKNLPKPDFAHDGKAATLLEKVSILDHVGILLGAHWFDFLNFVLSLFSSATYKVCEKQFSCWRVKDAKISVLLSFF
jgi:hypothetical protein